MIAEHFDLAQFTIWEKRPSKIRAGYTLSVRSGLKCPRCDHVNRFPGTNEAMLCECCGVAINRDGEWITCAACEPTPPDGWKPKT